MHQSRCVMTPPPVSLGHGDILDSSNVIFSISAGAFKSYFILDTSCILRGVQTTPRGLCLNSGSHRSGGGGSVCVCGGAQPLCLAWGIVLRLQDVRKLKWFIGCCSNYHTPTAAPPHPAHFALSREMDSKHVGLSPYSPAYGK